MITLIPYFRKLWAAEALYISSNKAFFTFAGHEKCFSYFIMIAVLLTIFSFSIFRLLKWKFSSWFTVIDMCHLRTILIPGDTLSIKNWIIPKIKHNYFFEWIFRLSPIWIQEQTVKVRNRNIFTFRITCTTFRIHLKQADHFSYVCLYDTSSKIVLIIKSENGSLTILIFKINGYMSSLRLPALKKSKVEDEFMFPWNDCGLYKIKLQLTEKTKKRIW